MTFAVPSYISAKHLAERLDVSENWLYDMAGRGEIPSVKIHGLRRFREAEVIAWLAENSGGQAAEVVPIRPEKASGS